MRQIVFCFGTLLLWGSMKSLAQSEPLKLFLPKDTEGVQAGLPKPANALTLVLGDNNEIFCYSGDFKKDKAIIKTGYAGVRKILVKKKKEFKDSLVILIKASGGASYKNTVDILDEMAINDIKRYALVDITKEEEQTLGLKPFHPQEPIVINTPSSVSERPVEDNKDILLIRIDGKGGIEYGYGKANNLALTKLADSDTASFGRMMGELIKGKSDYKVLVKGDSEAKYDSFKRVIDALKENNLFKFQMITEKD